MNEEQLKNYYERYIEMCNDCWRFIRKYSQPNDSEEFWQSMIREARELVDKDKESTFRRKMVAEAMLEIHRIWKKEQ